jgi:hypothetical protein
MNADGFKVDLDTKNDIHFPLNQTFGVSMESTKKDKKISCKS